MNIPVARRIRIPATRLVILWVGLLLPALPTTAQVTRTARDEWQKVEDIFSALELREGSYVADVGAGSGFFTLRLSERVGSAGRVYAVDIDADVLEELRERVDRLSLDNVEIILSETDDPRLPYHVLDAVLIVNAYHEMSEYEAMLEGIMRSLRPGGRLVIVDSPPSRPTRSREDQMERHGLALDLAAMDLSEAGFRVISSDPWFVELGSGRRGSNNWLLVAERPLERD
jgi:ubiquinone/menaquinone biosynthesis C-methylase UbiE